MNYKYDIVEFKNKLTGQTVYAVRRYSFRFLFWYIDEKFKDQCSSTHWWSKNHEFFKDTIIEDKDRLNLPNVGAVWEEQSATKIVQNVKCNDI